MTTLSYLKQRLMTDPEVREEYAKGDAEYAQLEVIIAARDEAEQTPYNASISTPGC